MLGKNEWINYLMDKWLLEGKPGDELERLINHTLGKMEDEVVAKITTESGRYCRVGEKIN